MPQGRDRTESVLHTWSKEFLEAGKRRLAGDTARAATSDEVKDLRREGSALKECVADFFDMPFDPNHPYSDLPTLPSREDVDTKAVLKASLGARAALAKLRIECH